jgi:phasin
VFIMTPNYDLKAAAEQTRKSYSEVTAKLGLLGFDTAIPEAVRTMAETSVAQTRQATDRSFDAFETSVASFEKSFDAAGQGAAAFNRKFIDLARRNLNASFDLAKSLAGARSLTDMVELQTAFWRAQFGALSSQAEEVRALSNKVTADTAAPMQAHMARNAEQVRRAS